jgi:archaetidylinositol phosphate synthase
MTPHERWWKNSFGEKEKDRKPVVISSKIGHSLDPAILGLYHILFRSKALSPNLITAFGAAFALLAAASIGLGHLILGGAILLVSGICDLMDGTLARSTNKVTAFGGFLDSVLDRYSDLSVMCGILVYFMRRGRDIEMLATFVASIGIAIIPYARARAEAALLPFRTGLLERPERIMIVLCGLFLNLLPYAVMILAIFTHVTVVQRILHARRKTAD